jgi:hypothetical protein
MARSADDAAAAVEPRSLDDLKAASEEIRAQLHWVRDYL